MRLPLRCPPRVMLPARMSASTTASADRDTSPSTEIFPLSCPSIRSDPAEDKVPLMRAPRPTTEISDALLPRFNGLLRGFEHYLTPDDRPRRFPECLNFEGLSPISPSEPFAEGRGFEPRRR